MKICEICGDEYEPTRSNQKYCKACGKNPEGARQHYARAEFINRIHAGDLHPDHEIVCKECGRKFVSSYNRSFCSAVCSEKHRIKTARCPVCERLLCKAGNLTGRGYCSDECRETAVLRKAKERGNYVACEQCGKMFIRRGYSNRFCSKSCSDLWKSAHKKQ